MLKFNIAGICIEIISEYNLELKRLSQFLCSPVSVCDISVEMVRTSYINVPAGKILIDKGIKWVDPLDGNSELTSYISDDDTEEVIIMLNLSKHFNKGIIYYRKECLDLENMIIDLIIELLFRYCVIKRDGFFIHAAAINYNHRGILFTAPSGTGKSTQAQLWQKYKDIEILNDDRPVIRMKDGGWYVNGTPWSGSSLQVLNKSVPLCAIVAIKQASQNSIRRLNSQEAIAYVIPRCLIPYFDGKLMDMALKHIDSVLKSTPVYLLSCRPDKEAVELVSKCIDLN